MKIIKFRGKAKHTNKWLCGDLIKVGDNYHIVGKDDMREDGHHITQDSDIPTWVDEKTIGQYIGLLDKNGKEIYEGDILEVDEEIYAKVVWNEEKASFEYEYIHPMHLTNGFYEFNMPYLSIIGNIHDNPELLKGV
jgi:uncharacterized phage protein (TIGR01671 family)